MIRRTCSELANGNLGAITALGKSVKLLKTRSCRITIRISLAFLEHLKNMTICSWKIHYIFKHYCNSDPEHFVDAVIDDLSGTIAKSGVVDVACWGCGGGQGEKLQKCGGCRMVRYCGVDCQRGDWRAHKRVCSHFKEALQASL